MSKPRRRGGPPTYTPETAAARRLGQVKLRLRPEEAAELRAWAEEHGGLAALVRQLLAQRRAQGRITLGLSPEDAAELRRLGAQHPGGMAGVVASWLRRVGS